MNTEKELLRGRLAIVDDDPEVRSMLADFFGSEGYDVQSFAAASEAFQNLQDSVVTGSLSWDVVLTDLNMPEMDGMEFTERVRRRAPDIPVIMITAFGSIESALEATRKGAYDYIVKPFKLSEIALVVNRAVRFRRLKKENEILRSEVKKSWAFDSLIGKGPAMRGVYELVERVAGATANVLITGESGTGKEMVARAIHGSGPRVNKPFVAINCTAIPESLMESELFGHAKGAFTGAHGTKKGLFEEADGGTLFLDEIGDMDLHLQAKLLRVLQDKKIRPVGSTEFREVNVRIIAATHKDLKLAIKEGRFREDLYYRLAVVPVVLPALRHRREDIPALAEFFLHKYAAANGSAAKGFTASALKRLAEHRWEGNVRELENLIERVVVLCDQQIIDEKDLPLGARETLEDFFARAALDLPTMEQLEKRYIELVLDRTGGKKEKAAQILGINRRTLYRKERDYGFVCSDIEEGFDANEAEGGLA